MKTRLDKTKQGTFLTTKEMLEKNVTLAYDEPWEALGPPGSDIDFANVQIRIKAKDAVNLKRHDYKEEPKYAYISDEGLLDEFIVNNWAYVVVNNEKNVDYKKLRWFPNRQLSFGFNGKVGKLILFRVYFDAALPPGVEKRYKIETSLPKLGIYKRNRYHETLEEAYNCCEKLFNMWYKSLNADI